jgi:hypothetical protein
MRRASRPLADHSCFTALRFGETSLRLQAWLRRKRNPMKVSHKEAAGIMACGGSHHTGTTLVTPGPVVVRCH